MANLSTQQLMFNQRLLAEHCITEDRAQELWKSLTSDDADGDHADLKASVAHINTQLLRVGLEIRGLSVNGRRYFAIVNTYPDEKAQAGIHMTANEQSFIRAVLQKLVEDEESSVSKLLYLREDSM